MRSRSFCTAASMRAVLGEHQVDDAAGVELVDVERSGIDGFGGKRLPSRTCCGHSLCLFRRAAEKLMLVPVVPAVNAQRDRPATAELARELDDVARCDGVSALVDAYLSHLAVERRLSPNTVESYGRDLAQLAAVCRRRSSRPVEALDRRALERSCAQLMGEGRSPRSVARAVACFRGFYRFLVVSGHRSDNPAVDLRAPRAWKTLPKFLSMDEVDRLLRRAGHDAAARPARSRADRAALRDGPARVGAGQLAPAGSESRERLPDDAPARAGSSGWCRSATKPSAWLTRYLKEGAAGAA